MSLENDAVKILAHEIKKVAQTMIDNAKFDKTVKGRITSYLGHNKYSVMINNVEYEALYGNDDLSINEIVYVTIVQNDYNNLIIRLPLYSNRRIEKGGNYE